ncbi:MAG: SulP family inorganic anion transporter [Crocinitomicaceae bacterium]|nr:SulP family inorganic anion transporter [Crocinitomicaceae bacterium]
MSKNNSLFSSFNTDALSGVVVFLVALPLCLGIAGASGASAFSGVITGIVGGLVVGYLSASHVSVSGPAASLIAIVIVAIQDLGFEAFLLAGVLAGVFQLILGFAKAGTFSNYIPSGVIQGMLSGIGLIIIFKEIPHAIGYDKEHEGDFFNYSLTDSMDDGYFNEIIHSFNFAHTGVIIITLISLGILIAFTTIPFLKKIKLLPGALIAVVFGVILNELFRVFSPNLHVTGDHLVKLPVPGSAEEFIGQFSFPDFTFISNPDIWVTALTIAAVASIASLLTIEAGDRMDPYKRYSSGNTELRAQGLGNILSCLIGGLPMTSVIVRTTANIDAGARTKFSAIFHGFLLLLTVILIPTLLNKIPIASLAAVLLLIGYKLASPMVFRKMWGIGKTHFIPFLVTAIGVVSLDLLKGVGIGLAVSSIFILKGNMKLAYYFKKEKHKEGEDIHIDLAQEVSFLNKAAIKQTLAHLPENSRVIINAENTVYIDYDVLEIIRDFNENGSKEKNINVVLKGFKENYNIENTIDSHVY